jgi:hypothetical protein
MGKTYEQKNTTSYDYLSSLTGALEEISLQVQIYNSNLAS